MVEEGMAYNWQIWMLYGGNNAQVRARKARVGIWARFGGEVRRGLSAWGTETPIEFAKAKKLEKAEPKLRPRSRPEVSL